MAARKRKLHLNWEIESNIWRVKKAFGFLPTARSFTEEALHELLSANEDIDVVLKYE